ncbi:MAG: hypothetical protein ABJO09_00865 [Hyphomicrobiales bacterium]
MKTRRLPRCSRKHHQSHKQASTLNFIKEQTEAIQQASSGAQTEKPKSRPSQGDGEAEQVSVAPDVETGSAEPEQLHPYEIAKEVVVSLRLMKLAKAIKNTMKLQFEKRVSKLETDDQRAINTIVNAYFDHVEDKLEQVSLDNHCEDILAEMSERIVQPADGALL